MCGLYSDGLDSEGEIGANDVGSGAKWAAAVIILTIDFDWLGGAAVELAAIAVEDDVARPIATDNVILPLRTKDARFGH